MLRVHARAESGRYLGSARCPCRTRVASESLPSRCARCLPKSRAAAAPRRVPSSPSRHCLSAGRGKSLALHHYSQLRWSSLFTPRPRAGPSLGCRRGSWAASDRSARPPPGQRAGAGAPQIRLGAASWAAGHGGSPAAVCARLLPLLQLRGGAMLPVRAGNQNACYDALQYE